jgi:hypothetical protein
VDWALRIGEANGITWDASPIYIDLSKQFPAIVIASDGQKEPSQLGFADGTRI